MVPRKNRLCTHPKVTPLQNQTYEHWTKNHLDTTEQPQFGLVLTPLTMSSPFSPPPSATQATTTPTFSLPQRTTPFSTPIQPPTQTTPSPSKIIPFSSRAMTAEKKIDFSFLKKQRFEIREYIKF